MYFHFQHELLKLGYASYVGPWCSSKVSDNRQKQCFSFKQLPHKHIKSRSYDCSVRVSNELGAAHPRVAKFSVFVVNANSILISIVLSAMILIFRVGLSDLFTYDSEVIEAVSDLTSLLSISVLQNGIQSILSGKILPFTVSK